MLKSMLRDYSPFLCLFFFLSFFCLFFSPLFETETFLHKSAFSFRKFTRLTTYARLGQISSWFSGVNGTSLEELTDIAWQVHVSGFFFPMMLKRYLIFSFPTSRYLIQRILLPLFQRHNQFSKWSFLWLFSPQFNGVQMMLKHLNWPSVHNINQINLIN